MPSAVICLVFRREGGVYYTESVSPGVGGKFLLHVCCNLLDRLVGGESFLHAPC